VQEVTIQAPAYGGWVLEGQFETGEVRKMIGMTKGGKREQCLVKRSDLASTSVRE